jgi:hypothetical protein
MNMKVSLTKRERRMYFFNLLLIYLVAMLVLGFLIFKNSFLAITVDYNLSKRKLEEGNAFVKQQKEAAQFVDLINTRITQMKGNTRQVFLERDIQRSIKDLRKFYDPNSNDLRQVGFTQAASFLTMQYEDKLVLSKTNGNLQLFEKQLGDCEIGFKQKQDLLNQKKLLETSRTGSR